MKKWNLYIIYVTNDKTSKELKNKNRKMINSQVGK